VLCGLTRLGAGSRLHAEASSALVFEVPDIDEAAASLQLRAADVILTRGDTLVALPCRARHRDS
jgi:hypothetical protein